jgi:hypothetical protein
LAELALDFFGAELGRVAWAAWAFGRKDEEGAEPVALVIEAFVEFHCMLSDGRSS